MRQQHFECSGVRHIEGAAQRVGTGNAGAARQQHARAFRVLQRVIKQLAVIRVSAGFEQKRGQFGVAIDPGRAIQGG